MRDPGLESYARGKSHIPLLPDAGMHSKSEFFTNCDVVAASLVKKCFGDFLSILEG